MQESTRYAVGIDVGTFGVRCVVGHVDSTTGVPTIIGVGEAKNSGMRKGTVVHLTGPAQAVDDALGEAERMSGHEVDAASISINGTHILSTKVDGMIAVGGMSHEITGEDLARLEEVATVGKIPANREVIEVVPHCYRLDGQDNIKDPSGMTGTRLEITANVVSALGPHVSNLHKALELAKVRANRSVPAVVAAARAVLDEQQLESGVAVVDMGAATTGLAVYEEGDLQYTSVLPVGGVNITNDLAIGLKTDPAIAERVKLEHGSAISHEKEGHVTIKDNGDTHTFSLPDIDEIIGARLDEIFESLQKEFKKSGRAGKLPSGVVLVGGGAHLRHIAEYAKNKLGLAVRLGNATGFGGVAEKAHEPQFAAAVGLMLLDIEPSVHSRSQGGGSSTIVRSGSSIARNVTQRVSQFFGRFKA